MAAEPLRILGRANSFNVRKVLWLCDELGVPFTREDWGRGHRPTSAPEFLRLNPAAQIPVVLDGGLALRESHAILRYLAAKHGAEALYPAALERRVRVEQWMDWVAYDLTHAMRGAFLGGQLQEPPWNNPWFVEQGRRDFTHCMRLLDAELSAGGPHICGEAFTLADIPLGLVVNRWFAVQGFEKPELP
ncbi:MAG: glutathione S-transferase N-terminal domain-containing protein, partial [Acetobacteraceae bacterium]|nr:glutathione S-transferase N-terminal domain-containing protein [Acetobacteraceae bacterium]